MGCGSSKVSSPTPVPNQPRQAWTEPQSNHSTRDRKAQPNPPQSVQIEAFDEGHGDSLMKLEQKPKNAEILKIDDYDLHQRDVSDGSDKTDENEETFDDKEKSKKLKTVKGKRTESEVANIPQKTREDVTYTTQIKKLDNEGEDEKEPVDESKSKKLQTENANNTLTGVTNLPHKIKEEVTNTAQKKSENVNEKVKKPGDHESERKKSKAAKGNNAKKKVTNMPQKTKKEVTRIPQPKWRHDYDLPAVDPTEGLGELPHIYKDLDRPIKVEDTFWPEKRKLIPDFDVMRKIDKHAIEAPNNISEDLPKLVKYLIRPAKNDLEKYRAIARWIGENIAYDVEGLFNKTRPMIASAMAALKERKAVCAGYSGLFQSMCKEAELPCDVINGKAKGYGYIAGSDKYEGHAWNKVTIENQPFLCDTTWASGGVGRDRKYVKHWKEHHFLSEPTFFGNSHLPLGVTGEVNQPDQLTEKPYESLETWGGKAQQGAMIQLTGATPWVLDGTIISEDNTGEIRVDIPRLVKLYVVLSQLPGRKQITANHVTISWEGTTAVIRYELPGPGKYHLSARTGFVFTSDEETENLFEALVTYCIQGKGKEKHPPNQLDDGFSFGDNPYGVVMGYHCVSHSEPIIEATGHRLLMQFACPPWGEGMYKLQSVPPASSSSKQRSKKGEEIEKCIYVDRYPGKEVCYIFLPRPGNYLFQQLIKREPGVNQYHRNAVFTIKSKFAGKSPAVVSPFRQYNDWGTKELFHEKQFSIVNMSGFTVRLENGSGLLTFRRPVTSVGKILVNIVSMEEKQLSQASSVVTIDSEPHDTELVHITIDVPMKGFYVLNLFVDFKFAGRFVIASDGKS